MSPTVFIDLNNELNAKTLFGRLNSSGMLCMLSMRSVGVTYFVSTHFTMIVLDELVAFSLPFHVGTGVNGHTANARCSGLGAFAFRNGMSTMTPPLLSTAVGAGDEGDGMEWGEVEDDADDEVAGDRANHCECTPMGRLTGDGMGRLWFEYVIDFFIR